MGYERNDRRYGSGEAYRRGGYDRYDPDERGFFDRAGDEVRSWFGDEDAERRRRMDERYDERYDAERGRYDNRYDTGRSYNRGYGAGSYDTGRYETGGRYASSEVGGYSSPDRYPNWARSNRDEYGRGRYSGGYSPTSTHYQRTGENREIDSEYGSPYGSRSYADTGYGYGDDRARRNEEYRSLYNDRGHGQGGSGSDPHGYGSWRSRQLEAFDRDYDEYRRENQQRFESEFGTWRQTRETQRNSLRQAREHQEVVGSDGVHVGKVDHIRGDRILLTKTDKDAGGHHHSIPSSWIASVDDKVHLSKTAEQAQQAWRDEDRNQGLFGSDRDTNDRGATNLNRSFSGTY
jgi:hypothetical protein